MKKKAAKKAAPKKQAVKPIPEGYHAITPYLGVQGAAKALEFYRKAFGAREKVRMEMPGGKIAHAEMKIGDSIVMLADEFPEMGFKGPRSLGGTSVNIHLYVRNVDAVVAQAVAAGATIKRPVEDQFYGDRAGTIEDPFGHVWWVSTHKEELSKAEIRKRAAKEMSKMSG
jgi:PhnB protein